MDANFARHHLVGEVTIQHFIDHSTCPHNKEMQGAFAIDLDFYQLDELTKNGYTYAESTCVSCYEPGMFLLYYSAQASPGYDI